MSPREILRVTRVNGAVPARRSVLRQSPLYSEHGPLRVFVQQLVGVLALSSALDALLASYYTNRQNQESAFKDLNRELLTWQDDLQATTVRPREAALAEGGDTMVLYQLADVVTLELAVDEARGTREGRELARTLAYSKSVSLSRLHLMLHTSGILGISVYIAGEAKLFRFSLRSGHAGSARRYRPCLPQHLGRCKRQPGLSRLACMERAAATGERDHRRVRFAAADCVLRPSLAGNDCRPDCRSDPGRGR
jgi:hypothetical protein